MKFNPFSLFKRKNKRNYLGSDTLSFGFNDLYSTSKALKLSAVYRAIELKSNAISSIPLEVYSTNSEGEKIKYSTIDSLPYLLNERPSSRLDAYTFWKMLAIDLDIDGNGYALIIRENNGSIKELIYVPPQFVSIPNADFIFEDPKYIITGYPEQVDHHNIIHLRNHTKNGIRGISTLSFASDTLKNSYATEQTTSRAFINGGSLRGIYTVSTYLDEEKRQEINENWNKTFSNPDSNGIILLEQGDAFSTIQMNNKDMMMIESRMFNVLDIARFFNVSPILLYDYSKMSYSGIEEVMLEFLSTTIQPILKKIESELNYKLFYSQPKVYNNHIKFDTSDFIKVGKTTNADYYSKLFNTGVLTVNEIRNEMGYKDAENGDTNYIQVNLMKLGESAKDELKTKYEEKITNQIL
jgi:HK97 family phage portal protein